MRSDFSFKQHPWLVLHIAINSSVSNIVIVI